MVLLDSMKKSKVYTSLSIVMVLFFALACGGGGGGEEGSGGDPNNPFASGVGTNSQARDPNAGNTGSVDNPTTNPDNNTPAPDPTPTPDPVVAPSAPSGLAATPDVLRVSLNWGAVENADSYVIHYSSTSSATLSSPVLGTSATNSFVHEPAQSNTLFRYIVAAVNSGGTSLASNEVSETPSVPLVAPNTPTGLSITSGNAYVTLDWDDMAGADKYYVFFGQAGNLSTSGANIESDVSSLTVSGLNDGTEYFYMVSANNVIGTSGNSSEVSGIPLATPVISSADPGQESVVLDWNDSAGADSYKIYFSNTAGVDTSSSNMILSGNSVYTHNSLTGGLPYFYIVTAVNTTGESLPSTEVNVTPHVVYDAPTNLILSAGNQQVTLTWDALAGATEYLIYRTIGSGANLTGPVVGSSNITSFTDTGLTNDTEYYYSVAGNNIGGAGLRSEEKNITPLDIVEATAGNLQAQPGDSEITLTWDNVAEATDYNVYVKTTSGANVDGSFLVNVSSGNHIDTGLSNGQIYYYSVTGNNIVSEGPRSDEVNATPLGAVVTTAANLSATGGYEQVSLAWDAVEHAQNYNIYFKTTTGADVDGAYLTTTSSNTYTHLSLNRGQQYFYSVAGNNIIFNEGPKSSEVNATTTNVPDPPINLVGVGGNTFNTLSWDVVPGTNIVYSVYFTEDNNVTLGTGNLVLSDNVGNDFLHTSLINGIDYNYIVTAKNDVGESSASTNIVITPLDPPSPPSPVVARSGNNLIVSWDPVTTANSYTIYYQNSMGVTLSSLVVPNAVSPQTIDGLTENTVYHLAMTATNTGGTSGLSNEVCRKTTSPWSPADMTTNLWLDASDNTTLSANLTSGNIEVWNDKSGANLHVTQSDNIFQPVTASSNINGLTTISFEGSHYFDGNGLGASNDKFNFFVVMSRDDTDNDSDIQLDFPTILGTDGDWSTSNSVTQVVTFENGTPKLQFSVSSLGQGSSGTDSRGNSEEFLDTWTLNGLVNSGNTTSFYRNGNDDGTETNLVETDKDLSNFNIGSWDTTTGTVWRFLKADIGEIILTTSDMHECERENIEGYLMHKWGLEGQLPSDHPHKNGVP